MPEEFWDEFFSFQIGPFGFWAWPYRPFAVRYSRTADSHVLQIKLRPPAKKEEIKVRLVEPGLLEIEWPRKKRGEEIPIE